MSDERKKRPPPLDRKKLQPQLVTAADAFSLMQYDERRRDTPALNEIEERGKLPGMPAVLADTAFALWAHEPGVKDEVPADRRYWRDLLGETTKSSAFKSLAAQTRSDWFLSTLGTIETAREILRLVPKEDEKKLDEVAKAQAEADQVEQDATQAQAEANALQQMVDQMMAAAGQGQSGSPSGSPQGQSTGNSGGLTAAQAQALAGKLAKAKAKAADARQLADMAKAEANAKADVLLGQPGSAEAERKLTELRRLGIGALKKSAEKVGELTDTIRAWGLESGELNQMPVPEAFGLLEKMRKNADFKAFANILGRLRAIATKKAKSNDTGVSRQIPRTETGRDLSRAHSSELVAYAAHPVTRHQMLARWSRGELRLRGTETKREKGRGPVVACRDSSGSMSGLRQQWATGVQLALASYAKVQRRAFGGIIFDTAVQYAEVFPAGRIGARDLLKIAETHSGGGTDFEAPLRRAMKMIDDEGLKKADIVFITDGECALGEKFLREFMAWKKSGGVTVVTIIIGDHLSDATVKQFSDRVERASAFTAEEAEAKVFANL